MKTDQRDQGLGAVLEASVSRIRPDGDAALAAVRRRGGTRRSIRFCGTVAAVSVFVGAVAWAGLGLAGHHGTPSDRIGLIGYVDPRTGWTVRYPESWSLTHVRPLCPLNADEGFLIDNVGGRIPIPPVRSTPDGHGGTQVTCFTSPRLVSIPATGVVVQLLRVSGGGFFFGGSDPRFPLTFADGRRTTIQLRDGRTITRYVIPAAIRARDSVMVWIGDRASRADVDAARAVVASLRLPDDRQVFDPEGTWSLRMPIAWFEQFTDDTDCAATVGRHGVFVSNVRFGFQHLDGTTTGTCNSGRWNLDELPIDAVLVWIEPIGRMIGVWPTPPETRFPLRSDEDVNGQRAPATGHHLFPVARGGEWVANVRVLVRPGATLEARTEAERVLESIRLHLPAAQSRTPDSSPTSTTPATPSTP